MFVPFYHTQRCPVGSIHTTPGAIQHTDWRFSGHPGSYFSFRLGASKVRPDQQGWTTRVTCFRALSAINSDPLFTGQATPPIRENFTLTLLDRGASLMLPFLSLIVGVLWLLVTRWRNPGNYVDGGKYRRRVTKVGMKRQEQFTSIDLLG